MLIRAGPGDTSLVVALAFFVALVIFSATPLVGVALDVGVDLADAVTVLMRGPVLLDGVEVAGSMGLLVVLEDVLAVDEPRTLSLTSFDGVTGVP